MSSPTSVGASWPAGRRFESGNNPSLSAPMPQLKTNNNERPSRGIESPEFDPTSDLNADDPSDLDGDDQISFSDYELEDEQPTVPRLASSILRENHEIALQVFEATEAQVEELKQRVNALEEEKRYEQSCEDFKMEINQLVDELAERETRATNQAAELQENVKDLKNENGILQHRLLHEQQNRVRETRSEQDLADARAEIGRLQITIQEQKSVIEQREQIVEEYAPSEEQEVETLRLQYQELEDKNRGLQEQHTKWHKLFTNLMQRASNLQRKDASMHQIKKGFKDLHKIVKEGELQDL